MGEVLHEVDFNQLKIENSQYLEKVDERNQDLLRLKLMATNVLQVLNTYKVSFLYPYLIYQKPGRHMFHNYLDVKKDRSCWLRLLNAKSKRISVNQSQCWFIHFLLRKMNNEKVSVIDFLENWDNLEWTVLTH